MTYVYKKLTKINFMQRNNLWQEISLTDMFLRAPFRSKD